MEKDSKNAAQRMGVVVEGMRYKNAAIKPEIEMAKSRDNPLDPVGIA
jgi:hypothetical protein